MYYDGPTEADYVNITALNREFLKLIRCKPGRIAFESAATAQLASLGFQQIKRLAATPFLLFDMRENDEKTWRELCQGDKNPDLFHAADPADDDLSNLLGTTVGFLWQLAQQNPHSVRLVCGGTPAWCELITGVTYFELVSLSRRRHDLLRLRQAAHTDIWPKLLTDGLRFEKEVREAAHIAALQSLLTGYNSTHASAWPVAACRNVPPQLRVADER